MATEYHPIDISEMPELRRIAEEVQASQEPRVLRRNSEDVAVIMPVEPKRGKRAPSVPRGKPTSADDPLWNIIGIGRSEGPTDVSANKHKYLAEAYASKHL